MSNARDHPGYQALRRGRWSKSGRRYLLTTVTEDRQRLFSDWKGASVAASVMSRADSWPGANLLCWVLMPDHWHGLVELDGNTQLADVVRLAKGRSARAINIALARSGAVWMPGFHDRALRREEGLVEAARYIVANPLRAGLVRRMGNYPFWDAIWLS
jgi:REP element-mobilizing transposase RayT